MRLLCTLLSTLLFHCAATGQIFNKKWTPKSQTNTIPRSLETKFDLNGGLIFIARGEDDGPLDNYLLDTGAPTLIINEQVPQSVSSHRIIGVNGASPVANKKIKDFRVQGMKIGTVRSYSTDLSNLERVKKQKIEGILGYKVLRPFELFIDYDRRFLMLFESGANDLHGYIKPVGEVNLKMKEHFPIVKVKIGKNNYYFGIDTGAEVNVIHQKWERKICKKQKVDKVEHRLHGLGKTPIPVRIGNVPEIVIGDETYEDLPFVFADLSGINNATGFELDGILGFPFLSSGKFSINYKKGKLYRWNDPLEEADALERLSLLSK